MRGSRVAPNVLAVILAMLFTYVTGTSEDHSTTSAQSSLMPPEVLWNGLSLDEKEAWAKRILSLPRSEFLERSARAFVEREDFKPTEIMGPLVLDRDEPPRLVAFREGKTYALSLPVIDAPLFPGLYWSQGWGSSWTVIQPDGHTVTYWVEREL